MKKVITGFFSFLLLFAGLAHADFINVLSQEYSIEGYIKFSTLPDFHSVTLNYQETSSLPVSQKIDNLGIPNITGQVWASSSAGGGVTSEYAWVESKSIAGDKGGSGYASSSSSITFLPLASTMLVSAAWNSGPGWLTEIELIDLTEGITLYAHSGGKGSDAENSLISFNTSHIYSINAVTDTSGSTINASLRIQSIPEPSTLLLLGAGIVGIVGFRRKFRK